MLRPRLALAFTACSALAAAPAIAAPIVHDTAAEFSAIVYNVGSKGTGAPGTVDAARQVIGNMFDNVLTTASITSLGRGGSMEFEIAPATGRYITGGQIIEATGGTSGFPESANVFLGSNRTGWVQIGTVRNGHAPNTAGVTNLAPTIATLSFSAANGATFPTFNFTVVSGFYDSVRIVDVPQLPSSVTTPSSSMDGFDIVEFEVTSEALRAPLAVVPEPLGIGLFGLGLAALTAVRRRNVEATRGAGRPS